MLACHYEIILESSRKKNIIKENIYDRVHFNVVANS